MTFTNVPYYVKYITSNLKRNPVQDHGQKYHACAWPAQASVCLVCLCHMFWIMINFIQTRQISHSIFEFMQIYLFLNPLVQEPKKVTLSNFYSINETYDSYTMVAFLLFYIYISSLVMVYTKFLINLHKSWHVIQLFIEIKKSYI